MSTAQEILTKAADLLDRPDVFLYKDRFSEDVPDDRLFCALTAIMEVGYHEYHLARDLFCEFLGTNSLPSWNDDPDRTKADVVEALREAAKS